MALLFFFLIDRPDERWRGHEYQRRSCGGFMEREASEGHGVTSQMSVLSFLCPQVSVNTLVMFLL